MPKKKIIAGALLGAALALPLAGGIASADPSSGDANNGVPTAIGELNGTNTPTPLGSAVSKIAQTPGSVKADVGAPGQALKKAGVTGSDHTR